MIISLPWPSSKLSPNARLHWKAKIGPKQDAKRIAGWVTVSTPGFYQKRDELAAFDRPIHVEMIFYPPDKRRRDDDNCIGQMKAARDAIAEALRIDDSRFRVTYKFCDPCKPGKVEVVL